MTINVLIPQKISQVGIDRLKEEGYSILVPPNHDEETLLQYIEEVDAIVARTEKYTEKLIQKADRLKIIARHGIGYDNVDVEAATAKGVVVTNTPVANINAVAELVLTLMLAGSRHLVKIDQSVRQGDFEIRNRLLGLEVSKKTLGIIGFGNIGKLLAEKCKFGFQMNILVFDPYVKKENVPDYVEITDSFEHILSNSDFITLHVPYTKGTHHLIDEQALQYMKRDAILINAARGGVVDEDALYKALSTSQIRGACVDVFVGEPPSKDHPLFKLDNVIVTPHLGAQTKEAYDAMASSVAEDIIAIVNSKVPKYPINLKELEKQQISNEL